jgi:4'-phosphopantetheinyl transferase
MTTCCPAPLAWRSAPADQVLDAGDVHVWRLRLVPPQPLDHTLDADERDRAARFYFERDRVVFTSVRGVLRTLAGRYLGWPAADIAFGYGARGKPYLARPAGDSLRFNVSHSGAYALLAFARGREVGVDVEQRRALPDLRSLAETSFSSREYAAWCALAPDVQPEAFFTCWTRKEAFIKATGEGISQLGDFDVSLGPGEPPRILRIAGLQLDQPRWSIHDLPAIAEHAAALVTEGRPEHIRCWDWQLVAVPLA